jgi:hypothetical protein
MIFETADGHILSNPCVLRGRCKGFSICPSCAQKRTLLMGENLCDDLLLCPQSPDLRRVRLLAPAWAHHRAGRRVRPPRLLLLYGLWRRKVVEWFMHKSLCQHIVRVPLSLQKIEGDEDQDSVPWKVSPTGYFQGRQMHFSCLDFIAPLTLHIPRGEYTCCAAMACMPRARGGTWKDHPALCGLAPQRWYGRSTVQDPDSTVAPEHIVIPQQDRRSAGPACLPRCAKWTSGPVPRGGGVGISGSVGKPYAYGSIVQATTSVEPGPMPGTARDALTIESIPRVPTWAGRVGLGV